MVTYSQHQWISFLRPNARALSLISSGDGGLTIFDGNTMYERFTQKKKQIMTITRIDQNCISEKQSHSLDKHLRQMAMLMKGLGQQRKQTVSGKKKCKIFGAMHQVHIATSYSSIEII